MSTPKRGDTVTVNVPLDARDPHWYRTANVLGHGPWKAYLLEDPIVCWAVSLPHKQGRWILPATWFQEYRGSDLFADLGRAEVKILDLQRTQDLQVAEIRTIRGAIISRDSQNRDLQLRVDLLRAEIGTVNSDLLAQVERTIQLKKDFDVECCKNRILSKDLEVIREQRDTLLRAARDRETMEAAHARQVRQALGVLLSLVVATGAGMVALRLAPPTSPWSWLQPGVKAMPRAGALK